MAQIVAGVFRDPHKAQEAVSELKREGFRDDVSVISKTWQDTRVKKETPDSGVEGGIVGALVGGLAGLLIGSGAFFIPGIGTVLAAGPLSALLGATGALTGGLLGFLVDAGIPEEKARHYEEAVGRGDVLVTVSASGDGRIRAREILENHGAKDSEVRPNGYASA